MISLARYTNLLERRDIRHSFVASFIGRLPIGITGLAILLLVQMTSGSFAYGGAAAACYVAGLALVAPGVGRFIDRYGPHWMLFGCAFLFPAALLGLVVAVTQAAAPWLTLALAGGAGASFPPITVCMRSYFRQRLNDDALLAAAYSLESVLIELIFIAGPMLVALFVAIASPAVAVAFAALCGSAGALLFMRSAALRGWRIEARAVPSLLGPLAELRFVLLIVVVLCFTTAFGFTEIGITAYAAEAGKPALAGVLLGLMSAGSALGGIAYGSRGWRLPLTRQLAAMLALMSAGLAVLALPWGVWLFALWSMIAGIVMAPALIIQSMLVAKTAHQEHTTEAFTWSASALLSGVGLGLAGGGILLERWPWPAPIGAAAAGALLAAAGARFALRGH